MTLRWGVPLLLAGLCGNAAAAPCTPEETGNARAAASEARDWEAVYDLFHRFGHCTAVAVSEAFAQSIGRLLAHRWSELYELEYFAEASPTFRAFVVEHIDVTISAADLSRIVDQVESCPGYARPICREIAASSRSALRLKRAASPAAR